MALSEHQDIFRKEADEIDLMGANYYKLPFCDEDIKQFEQMERHSEDWVNSMLENRFMNGSNELLTPASPSSSSGALSPSSNSSSSSSGNGTNEHAYSLINDRPDTPLTAIKFEEFSNDYQLDQFEYSGAKETYSPAFADFHDDFNLEQPGEKINNNFAFVTDTEYTFDDEHPVQALKAMKTHHTMDQNLGSALNGIGSSVITISKMGNTVHVKKEEPDEPMDYSMCKLQKDTQRSTRPATLTHPLLSTTNCSTLQSSGQANILTLASDVSNVTPTSHGGETTTFPLSSAHATAKVTTNALTHRTQIQIPTSTLQTILKSGRLITRLQQEGQFLPRIKIKTEPCDGDQQYVRICHPQIDVLPPTPPSSNTSDNEGSSSPRGVSNNGCIDSSVHLATNFHDLTSGNQLSARLLTSPQRLTQSNGPLLLTEEERRTLESEGYPIPEKLPLTKVEEKALKKVRRKIKNKISAQESRRKKKEYVEALERKMECYNQENGNLRRKLDSLENSNQNLLGQLRSLQQLVAEKMPKTTRMATTQTSSCLMVVVLCFAVFLGGWMPFLSPFTSKDPMTSMGQPMDMMRTLRSRVILSYTDDAWEEKAYCDVSGCYGDSIQESTKQGAPDNEMGVNEEGADTYDEPKSGRVVMNDTKDQIIANTMEPRDVAAVLASRKVAATGKKSPMAVMDVIGHDTRKIVSVSNSVTE